MQPLTVQVEDEEHGTRREFVFSRSPVRIGRSPLNDLPLERPFVSHCHAVLHFSGPHFEYVDLGSTNGSYVDGQRVPQNVSVPLSPSSTLQIGALSLRLSRGKAAPHTGTRASYAFDPFDAAQDAAGRLGAAGSGPVAYSTGARQAVDALAHAHHAYRTAWQALLADIRSYAATLPPAESKPFARMLQERYPELLREPEFAELLRGARQSSMPPQGDVEELLSAATGMPLSASLRAPLSARLMQVLERFAQTFLELQRGRSQFASEMAVPMGGANAIESARDARELLRRLFDLADPDDPVDQLSRAYADLMLHQVALLNGVRAGISHLLRQLDPATLAQRAPGGIMGWLGRLFGVDGRWRQFRQAFEDLEEQKALSRVVFGDAFARAYAASMGAAPPVLVEKTTVPPKEK